MTVGGDGLSDWATALYTAAAQSYAVGKRMPDRIWCSLDVWAALGAMTDVGRLVLPPGGNNDNAAGSSSLSDFRGDVLGLPRIVVPEFAPGTCVVGPSTLYEAYEEIIGLLSVIEPSILGVEVAYGGYVAYGSLQESAFTKRDASRADGDVEHSRGRRERRQRREQGRQRRQHNAPARQLPPRKSKGGRQSWRPG